MIRVLHIVGSLCRGGIESFIMNVYREIDRTKIQFDFLTSWENDGDFGDEILSLGGKIYRITPRNKNIRKNKRELDIFFKNHKEYSIVHQHVSSLSYIEPLIAAKNNGVKTRIIHGHSTSQKGKIHKLLHFLNKTKIDKIATDYFACSRDAAKWIAPKRVIDDVNYQIIKNGIKLDLYKFNEDIRKEYRNELNIKSNEFIIGHVGRFAYPKNHEFLIMTFNKYHKLNPSSKLLLVGTGALFDEIKQEIIRLNIEDSVIFTGVRSDVPELMMAMDVFLFPSIYEGLGIVAIEAQASGLPCFTSDKVPQAVCINSKCEQLKLSEPDKWIEKLCNIQKSNAEHEIDCLKEVCVAGYDIEEVSKNLVEFYLSRN